MADDHVPQNFLSSREAEGAHPGLLIRTVLIAKEHYKELCDSYTFGEEDEVQCQVTERGNRCNTAHQHGWIVRGNDDSVGYVGIDCSEKHFGKDPRFKRDKTRINAALNTTRRVDRLAELLAMSDIPARTETALRQQRALDLETRRLKLPVKPLQVLMDMMRGRRTRTITLHFEFPEPATDADGNPKKDAAGQIIMFSRWNPQPVGAMAVPSAFDFKTIEGIRKRIHAARETMASATADRKLPYKELRAAIDKIEDFFACEKELDKAVESWTSFREERNLRLLCWVCVEHEDQLQTARAIREMTGSKPISRDEGERILARWKAEVTFEDRRFEVR